MIWFVAKPRQAFLPHPWKNSALSSGDFSGGLVGSKNRRNARMIIIICLSWSKNLKLLPLVSILKCFLWHLSIRAFLTCFRFGGWNHGGGWGYRDYDRWRQQDGMLCRYQLQDVSAHNSLFLSGLIHMVPKRIKCPDFGSLSSVNVGPSQTISLSSWTYWRFLVVFLLPHCRYHILFSKLWRIKIWNVAMYVLHNERAFFLFLIVS